MGLTINLSSCVLCFVFLLPALCVSKGIYTYSRATYYDSPDGFGTPSGECEYGEFGRTVNGGQVAAVSRLYRNGTGCGACYQVRCTIPQLCTREGVKVVITDRDQGKDTDFILSPRGFTKLAQPNKASELQEYSIVDIEYRRISCNYPGYNLMFMVHENSRFPEYLAIFIIYQGGQSDITAVELWQKHGKQWRGMRNAFGAVWDMPHPPKGPITLRFQVVNENGEKQWLEARNAIPTYWEAGVAYDTYIQLP